MYFDCDIIVDTDCVFDDAKFYQKKKGLSKKVNSFSIEFPSKKRKEIASRGKNVSFLYHRSFPYSIYQESYQIRKGLWIPYVTFFQISKAIKNSQNFMMSSLK